MYLLARRTEKLILFSVDLTIALVFFCFSLLTLLFLYCCSCIFLRWDLFMMWCVCFWGLLIFFFFWHVLEGTISVYKHKRVNMIKKKRHVQTQKAMCRSYQQNHKQISPKHCSVFGNEERERASERQEKKKRLDFISGGGVSLQKVPLCILTTWFCLVSVA